MATHKDRPARAARGRLAALHPEPDFPGLLADMYRTGADVDLRALVERHELEGEDDLLADLVNADARLRLKKGLPVDLDRYLGAIPGLRDQPCALDTAIEMALRAIGGGSDAPTPSAVEALSAAYPEFRVPIQTSTILSQIVCSTSGLDRVLQGRERALPQDFGPLLRDGRIRYELRDLIGSGAHGSVYVANDRQMAEPERPAWVAVKILREGPAGADHDTRLADEATRVRSVDHPNVVRVLDRGVSDDGEQFLVYEYVRGGDLAAYIAGQSTPFSPRAAAQLVAAVARGLQAAHAAGVAHRDLKPGNVLMTERGEPKIADFGIAVRIGDQGQPPGSARMGNLAFISPEQFRCEPASSSPSSDIYAAGGLLYWLLTAQYPNGATPEEVHKNLEGPGARSEPPHLGERRRIDPNLAAICRRALHPVCRKRYQSAEALARDLEDWLDFRPLPWRRYTPARRAVLFARREPAAMLGVAALVALLMAAGALAVYLEQRGVQHELKLELQKKSITAAADKHRVQQSLIATQAMLAMLKKMPDEEQYFPIMTALEIMAAPVFFSSDADARDLYSKRSDAVRALLQHARESGRENDLEVLVWQTVYGYWQIRLNNLAEARQVLEENAARLRAVKPGDPWIDSVEALLACIDGQTALAAVGPDRAELLRTAAQALGTVDVESGSLRLGLPVRRLVFATQAELYGSQALHDPAKAEQAKRELRDLK
jgi:hypothetical protein